MREHIESANTRLGQVIVWVAFSTAFLSYLRWGSEIVSLAPYYHIRRSVPSIWNAFYRDLPRGMNGMVTNFLYSISLAVMIFGVLVLFWFALSPDEDDPGAVESEQPRV